MTTLTENFRRTLYRSDGSAAGWPATAGDSRLVRRRSVALMFCRHIEAIARVTRVVRQRRPIVCRALDCPPPLELALGSLTQFAELQDTIGCHTAEVVALARASGATWNQIGDALGITKQAAHERFRRPPESPPAGQPAASPRSAQPPVPGVKAG